MKIKTKDFTPERLAEGLANAVENGHLFSTANLIVTRRPNGFDAALVYASGDGVMKRLRVTVTEE
jgi:hypothetical protein